MKTAMKLMSKTFILFILFGAISCEKKNLEEEVKSEENYVNEENRSGGGVDPSNPANEYDSFGSAHNTELDVIFASGITLESTNEDVYAICGIDPEHASLLDDARPQFGLDPADYTGSIAVYYAESPEIIDYTNAIMGIASDEDLSLAQKIEGIKLFEDSYPYDVSMDPEKKAIAKVTSAIARYSLYFWAPVSEGGLGRLDDLSGDEDITGINWYEVGAEDFYSACFSAFFTANPFGALAGGIGGSAIGLISFVA